MQPYRSIFIIVLTLVSKSFTQDFNFSQFYNTPIIINPANTGRFDKDFRLGLIHRSAFNTYTNSALMADLNFYNTPLKTDKMGAGLYVFNDRQGNGQIGTNGFLLSGATHYSLDELQKHRLSFGLQLGMAFSTLNLSDAKFASDFDQTTNQFSSNTDKSNQMTNTTQFKSAFGLVYDLYFNKSVDVFLGFTAYNFLPSKQNYLTTNKSSTPIKIGLQLGMNYKLSNKIELSPTINFIQQASSKDLILGLNFSYYLINDPKTNHKTAITLGAWHRLQDAMIAYIGLKYNNFQIGFSYDITVSSLASAKGITAEFAKKSGAGAWEISLFYSGFLNRAIPNKTTVPCQTF